MKGQTVVSGKFADYDEGGMRFGYGAWKAWNQGTLTRNKHSGLTDFNFYTLLGGCSSKVILVKSWAPYRDPIGSHLCQATCIITRFILAGQDGHFIICGVEIDLCFWASPSAPGREIGIVL